MLEKFKEEMEKVVKHKEEPGQVFERVRESCINENKQQRYVSHDNSEANDSTHIDHNEVFESLDMSAFTRFKQQLDNSGDI